MLEKGFLIKSFCKTKTKISKNTTNPTRRLFEKVGKNFIVVIILCEDNNPSFAHFIYKEVVKSHYNFYD